MKGFKEWYIKSALLDFQDGNNYALAMIIIFIGVNIIETYPITGLLFVFISSYIAQQYSKFGRKFYHLYLCEFYEVKPKTKNITFK